MPSDEVEIPSETGVSEIGVSETGVSEIGVQVLLFSVLREHVGTGEMVVSLPEPATGDVLLDRLVEAHPSLGAYRSVVRLAVNQSYSPSDTRLHDGDEVALITPVSGG